MHDERTCAYARQWGEGEGALCFLKLFFEERRGVVVGVLGGLLAAPGALRFSIVCVFDLVFVRFWLLGGGVLVLAWVY